MTFKMAEVLQEFVDASVFALEQREAARAVKFARDVTERFMSYVLKGVGPDACWIWTGGHRFHMEGRGAGSATSPKMYAFELLHGRKPTKRVWSACRDARCVRHLVETNMMTMLPGSRFRMQTPNERRQRTSKRPTNVRTCQRFALGLRSRMEAAAATALLELDAVARQRVLNAVRTEVSRRRR